VDCLATLFEGLFGAAAFFDRMAIVEIGVVLARLQVLVHVEIVSPALGSFHEYE